MSGLSIDDVALLVNSTRNDLNDLQDSFQSVTQMLNSNQDNISYAILKTTALESADLRINTNITNALAQVSTANTLVSSINATVSGTIIPGFSTMQTQVASAISANQASVAYVQSTVPAVLSDIALLKTEYSTLNTKEATDVTRIEGEIIGCNSSIASVSTRVTANATGLTALSTVVTGLGNTVGIHQTNIQSLIDSVQSISDKDNQAYASIDTLKNQVSANSSVLDGLFATNGAVTALQGLTVSHTSTLSTIGSKQVADEAQISSLASSIIPGLQAQISSVSTLANGLKSAEDWANYKAKANIDASGNRIVGANGLTFTNGYSLVEPSANSGVALETGSAYPYAVPATFNFSYANYGIYDGRLGNMVASEAGVSNPVLRQNAWYLAVHDKAIQGIRMWDKNVNGNMIGGDAQCSVSQFTLAPVPQRDASGNVIKDASGNDVVKQYFGAMFQIPKSWHFGNGYMNADIRFSLYESVTVANANGPYQRECHSLNANVKRDTSFVEVVDSYKNGADINVFADSTYGAGNDTLFLTLPGGYIAYTPLPKYDDAGVQSHLTAHDAHLTGVDGSISSLNVNLGAVDAKANSIMADVAGVHTTIAPYDGRISTCEAVIPQVSTLNAEYTTLAEIQTGQASQLSALTTRVNTDETNISSLQSLTSFLSTSVSAITTSGVASHWAENKAIVDVDINMNKFLNVTSATFVAGSIGSLPLALPEPTSGVKWGIAVQNDSEKSMRLVKQSAVGAQTIGYLLDTINNAPEVRSSNPGQLQIRCQVPGGSGLTYIGNASNVTPRIYVNGGTYITAPFDATSQLVWSGSIAGNIYTGAGIYEMMTTMQVLTTPGGSIDYSVNQGFRMEWKWSIDNTTYYNFSKQYAYGYVNGVIDSTFISNEANTANAPTTSGTTVYLKCYVKANSATSSFVQMVGNPVILQIR